MKSKRKWYDFHIIVENKNFVVVPALGSIVPGYLLIVPKQHVLSMAKLSIDLLNELIDFSIRIEKLQSNYWGLPIIFEHGMCSKTESAGACINHAHWHMVPGNWDLLSANLKYMQVPSFLNFAKNNKGNKPYLLFINKDKQSFIIEEEGIPHQYFRRQLARLIGEAEKWDYVVYPFFENMKETLTKLTT